MQTAALRQDLSGSLQVSATLILVQVRHALLRSLLSDPQCVATCLPADTDGCGVHMAWDPGPRILMLIFKTTVTASLVLAQHLTSVLMTAAFSGSWGLSAAECQLRRRQCWRST